MCLAHAAGPPTRPKSRLRPMQGIPAYIYLTALAGVFVVAAFALSGCLDTAVAVTTAAVGF